MRVLEHLESHLGETEGGWKNPGDENWPFFVFRFSRGPIAQTVTHATVGLSDYPLKCPVSGKQIRLELVFMARSSLGDRNIPAILHDLGVEAMARNLAFLRGDVIGPRGKLFSDSEMEGLYVAIPVYLPDSFATCEDPKGVFRVFAWLIPITRKEAEFVQQRGWKEFEAILLRLDPDLLDINRVSIV